MKTIFNYHDSIDFKIIVWRHIFDVIDTYTDKYLNTKSESDRIVFSKILNSLPTTILVVYRGTTKCIDAHKDIDEMLDGKIKSLLVTPSSDSPDDNNLSSIMYLLDIYATKYINEENVSSLIRFDLLLEKLPEHIIVMYRNSTKLSFVHDLIDKLLAKTRSTV